MTPMAALMGCVFVSLWPTWCVCFSHGGSPTSCVDMKPGHVGAQPQHAHTLSAVSIHTSRMVYLPQHTLTVSVRSSRAFMGFLLQARSVAEDRVVGGEFRLYPSGTHTLSCLSSSDTVTHSDKLLKRNLSFTWRAPPQPSGDLRFYITVVHSYFVHWTRIRSALVHDGTRSHDAGHDSGLQKTIILALPSTANTQVHTAAPTNTGLSQHTLTNLLTTYTQTHTTGTFSTHHPRNNSLTRHTPTLPNPNANILTHTRSRTSVHTTHNKTHPLTHTPTQSHNGTWTHPLHERTAVTPHITTRRQTGSSFKPKTFSTQTTHTPSNVPVSGTQNTNELPIPATWITSMPPLVRLNTLQTSYTLTRPTTTPASTMPAQVPMSTTLTSYSRTNTLNMATGMQSTSVPTQVPPNSTHTSYTLSLPTTTVVPSVPALVPMKNTETSKTRTTNTLTTPTWIHSMPTQGSTINGQTHNTRSAHTLLMPTGTQITSTPTRIPPNTTQTSNTLTMPPTSLVSPLLALNDTQTSYTLSMPPGPEHGLTNTTHVPPTKITHKTTMATTTLASFTPAPVSTTTTHTPYTETTHGTSRPTSTLASFSPTPLLLNSMKLSNTQTTLNLSRAFATLISYRPQTSNRRLTHTLTRGTTTRQTQELPNTDVLTHTATPQPTKNRPTSHRQTTHRLSTTSPRRHPYIRGSTPPLQPTHTNTTPVKPTINLTSSTPVSYPPAQRLNLYSEYYILMNTPVSRTFTNQHLHSATTPASPPQTQINPSETRTTASTLPTTTHTLKHPLIKSHTFSPASSFHLEPSPPLRRSLHDHVKPSDRAEEALWTNTVSVPRPDDGFKVGGGVTPESGPGLTSQPGLLLGIFLAVLVVLVIYVQRKLGVKRHRMSLSENSRRSAERWRAEECGELVRLRRLRENSLLLLQAQYDIISGASGS